MAKAYLKAGTPTELFTDIRMNIRNMRVLQEELKRLKDIMAQMSLDGEGVLAGYMGFQDPEDAQAVSDLISSSLTEIENSPFYQQAISRIG